MQVNTIRDCSLLNRLVELLFPVVLGGETHDRTVDTFYYCLQELVWFPDRRGSVVRTQLCQ